MTQGSLQAALPREMYVDEQSWLAERETVLFGQWYCIGRLDDLGLAASSRVVVVDVVGESVLVTSDDDGQLHGAYNVCRHRGSQLRPVVDEPRPDPLPVPRQRCAVPTTRGPTASTADCMHAPHADLDGRTWTPSGSTRSPSRPGAASCSCTSHRRRRPRSADCGRQRGQALANYGLAGLVTGATLTYEVAANYKVLLENYNECYHCGPVHPELCRLVPTFAGGGDDLDWEDGIPHREGAWTFTMSGTTTRAPLPGLTEQERTRHKGDLVYPNLLLSASADHVAAFVLMPRGVDRTDVVCSLLFAADEAAADRFDPRDAAELWDLVNRQDWAVCESVQRGMSSRSYRHGWFAPMEDDSLDIRRWLLPLLEQEP